MKVYFLHVLVLRDFELFCSFEHCVALSFELFVAEEAGYSKAVFTCFFSTDCLSKTSKGMMWPFRPDQHHLNVSS